MLILIFIVTFANVFNSHKPIIAKMKTKEQKLKYEKPVMRVHNMKPERIICISGEWGLED